LGDGDDAATGGPDASGAEVVHRMGADAASHRPRALGEKAQPHGEGCVGAADRSTEHPEEAALDQVAASVGRDEQHRGQRARSAGPSPPWGSRKTRWKLRGAPAPSDDRGARGERVGERALAPPCGHEDVRGRGEHKVRRAVHGRAGRARGARERELGAVETKRYTSCMSALESYQGANGNCATKHGVP
jgi:hypothetical protein